MTKRDTRPRRIRYRSGDVVAVPLPDGTFGYGRILLDIFRIRRTGVFPEHCSVNDIYGSGLLFQLLHFRADELLKGVERLAAIEAFPSQYMAHDQILHGEFPIIGNLPVVGEDVDFPEHVSLRGDQVYFEKGGVRVRLATGMRAWMRAVIDQVTPETAADLPRGSYALGINPDMLLRQLESPELVSHYYREDLRLSPERRRILRLAGLSEQMTYDQMAARTDAPLRQRLLDAI